MEQSHQRRFQKLLQHVNDMKTRNDLQKQRHIEIKTKHQEDTEISYYEALKIQEAKDKSLRAIMKNKQEQLQKKLEQKAQKMDNIANLKREEIIR